MPVLNLYNLDGSVSGTVEVNESIFGIEPNKTVMHEVLTAELADLRQGSASTKTRAEVRGGGRKPFKQKGTGRARQGSIRAPHMVGGGVAHGPKPRSYTKKVNKKVRKLAIKSALSEKFKNGDIVVLNFEKMEVPKTRTFIDFSKKIGSYDKKQLYVVSDFANDKDYYLHLSMRNVVKTSIVMPNELSIYWLLKQEKVIITKEALENIEEVLA